MTVLEWLAEHAEDFTVEEWRLFVNHIEKVSVNAAKARLDPEADNPEVEWYLSNLKGAISLVCTQRGGTKPIGELLKGGKE